MMSIITNNINEAITKLKTGDCTSLNAANAGWGDDELFRIIKCLALGYGNNLITINLNGNHFSQGAKATLYCVIGRDTAQRAQAAAATSIAETYSNPQMKS